MEIPAFIGIDHIFEPVSCSQRSDWTPFRILMGKRPYLRKALSWLQPSSFGICWLRLRAFFSFLAIVNWNKAQLLS